MADRAILDHTVINTRYQMDAAEARFGALGFQLTARGYHTLGSINHLMMFGTDYLELIGLPESARGQKSGRADIETAPAGINGLVFKSSNVDETFAHLEAIGMAGDPPKSFSRPVALADGTFDARFRTVHVRPDVFPGGRVYFCEHGTPELVWRRAWQQHANGAQRMPEFVIASRQHAAEAQSMAALLRSDVSGSGDQLGVALNGAVISFLSTDAYARRYGDLASDTGARSSIFGAMVIAVDDIDAVRAIAGGSGWAMRDAPGRVVVRDADFDCVIEFVE